MEKYLDYFLFEVNMFGGSYRDPEKSSDNCKASAQTGEVPTKPTEFIVFSQP